MGRDELLRLFDAGDYYGLAVRANRLLLEKEHPEAEYAVLGVHIRNGVPDLMIPVLSPTPAPAVV